MNYEKKYNEALEKARIAYNKITPENAAVKKLLEESFPELAESEDERVRKCLIAMVNATIWDSSNLASKKACLAWLEKQKEQKPTDQPFEEWLDGWFKEHEEDGEIKMTAKEFKNWSRGIRNMFQQKPVEIKIDNPYIQKIDPDLKISTSDSSASGDGLIYASWHDEKAEQKPNIELIQRSWYMEGYHDCEFGYEPKWIIKTGEGGLRYEENPKYGQIIEQKPVEWSEDFDKEVENIHKRYPEVSFAKLTRIAYHFSKWANRCKDIEWSEDDESCWNLIWDILDGSFTASKEGYKKAAAWFLKNCPKKQKEQRPIEKQDYSGLNDFERAIHRGFLCAGVVNVPVNIIKETAQDCLAHLPVEWSLEDDHIIGFVYDLLNEIEWKDDWAMSKEECLRLLNNYSPQKPAEWSVKGRRGRIGDTPKHIRKKAENFLSKMEPPYDADDVCSAYETGAMESIMLEWSEEDKKMIDHLIEALPIWANGLIAMLPSQADEYVEWLKSLRPQPKRDGLDDYMKGYSKGYADAEKEYNERTSYHIDVPNNWPPKMPDLPTQTTTNDIQSNAIPHWKPSKDEERLINTSISFLKDFADKGYENAVECIDWLKSKLNGNTCK